MRVSAGFVAALVAAFVTLLLCGHADASFEVPARPDGPVYDGADVLTSAQEEALASKLVAFRDKDGPSSGPSVVVAVLPSLEGESIKEVSYEIAAGWGIGSKERNDGVLLLISAAEARKAGPGAKKCGCARIEVGEYVEGMLTDARSLKILKEHVLAPAVSGDFDGAANGGADAILGVLGGDPEAAAGPTSEEGSGIPDLPWWLWLALILLGGYVLYLAAKHGLLAAFFDGGGGGSWGGGGGGGGGGSSFGGGSFGGGGADV